MSTREISISGLPITVPQPYSEGHSLSAAEAYVLNQTYAENIRNNSTALIKKHLADHKVEKVEALPHDAIADLKGKIHAYASDYEFSGTGRGGPRASIDPVAREAHKMAGDMVRTALRGKGVDLKTLPEGRLEELISGVLLKRPDITEEAQRRVDASKAIAGDLLDSLGA